MDGTFHYVMAQKLEIRNCHERMRDNSQECMTTHNGGGRDGKRSSEVTHTHAQGSTCTCMYLPPQTSIQI